MALRDQPYLPLYVKDFISDEKLRLCSPATVGVYIMLMCVLHRSETYGALSLKDVCYNKIDNKNITEKERCYDFVIRTLSQFAIFLERQLPFKREDIEAALKELHYFGVIKLDGETLYQPRMVRDGEKSDKKGKAGRLGMRSRWSCYNKTDNKSDNTSYNKTDNKVDNKSDNKNITDTENANEYNIIDNKGVKGENKKAEKFIPPTVEEVAAYCKERNNAVDPELFVDHYEANGWVQGSSRKQIKDWKACVRTWERNGINRQNYGTTEKNTQSRSQQIQTAGAGQITRHSTL